MTSPDKGQGFAESLRQAGHEVVQTDSPETGCAAIADQRPDLVLVDAELAEEVARVAADLDVATALLGAHLAEGGNGTVGQFPNTMTGESGVAVVELLLEREQMRRTLRELQSIVTGVRDGSALVGRSPLMRRLQSTLSRAADGDTTVLIEGAPGVGKSMAARVVHCKSRRGNKPLVVHGGATLDADALQRAFAEAQSSTLLIEDVEQMPAPAQQSLVRFLKERASRPGSDNAHARIIATSSAHLPELVARGAFREDLYYRLHSYPIVVPSLRERTEDIAMLAESLLHQISASSGQRPAGLTAAGRAMLESMSWPGNVAQLENVVRRAFLVAGGGPIDERHLTLPALANAPTASSTAANTRTTVEAADDDLDEQSIRPFEEEEQRLLSRALRATRGNVRRAAQLLGIGRATLYRKIQQFKLRLQ
ncbi:MAG: sigma 54-interacting transcriptional regulator [Planctomycetota bacterium]